MPWGPKLERGIKGGGGSGCLFGLGFTEMSGKVPAGIVVVIGI